MADDMMKGGLGMSPRKAMAMGKGPKPMVSMYPGSNGKPHPDVSSGVGLKGAMADSARSGTGDVHGPDLGRQMDYERGPRA